MNTRRGDRRPSITPNQLRSALLRPLLVASLPLLAVAACTPPSPTTRTPQTAGPAPCKSARLSLRLDGGDGRFNGMSHSGALLILQNIDTAACTIAAMPLPTFRDTQRQTLAIAAQASSPPANAVPVLVLPPGARVESELRWVSGNVYDDGHCESPASIALALGTGTLTAPFDGHLCGAGGKPSMYSLTPFRISVTNSAAISLTYTCEDGRTVYATYPDTETAVLRFDAQIHHLHTAVSADGARYVGEHWQWWSKGMHDATLAKLKPGEQLASATGVACRAP